ncbi:acyl-CoA thioesterase [Candidatus Protochlamydia phocaeensis]|uniref:acyl-CoA thioesterase n=1 Tax=Candidatus Protochlamydia phocaeensis TaxID=1414722 RepID=UPI000838A1E1|nr:acyl-CoA thioesterase [Candidatus Protochlamydia phocaeensis]
MNIFKREIFIPFHLVDAAGIVFFGHVFGLAHQVFENFILEGISIPWKEWFQNPDWIIPIKQTDAVYYAPLKAGSTCHVHLQIAEIRPSSFSVTYAFMQEQLCCTVKTVHVFCKRETQQKHPLPLELSVSLAKYLPAPTASAPPTFKPAF